MSELASSSSSTARRYVLAVDFGGTKASIALVDVAGAVLTSERLAINAEQGAEQAVVRTLAVAARLIADHGGEHLQAAGVASPGIVLPDRILLAPNVPGWSQLRLQERFEHALGVPALCATDVKAATLAEARWGHLQGLQTGMYLNLGTGIAVGVLVDGKVLTGAHGAAGEIGYNLRSAEEPAGPHDGLAPLEERVGGRAIGERGRLVGGTGTAASVFALARHDPAARAFVEETLGELALHIANAAILVDPERITVAGGMAEAADVVLPALESVLKRAVPFPPELVVARFAQDGPLVGAAALAWEVGGLTSSRSFRSR